MSVSVSSRKRQRPRRGRSDDAVALEGMDLTQSDHEEPEDGVAERSDGGGGGGTSPYFDKKASRTLHEQEPVVSRRAAAQARVAHSRAAHFARAPVSSSCPTGVVGRDNDPLSPSGEESWPGPFSTANDMLKKREAAKQARAAVIAEKDRRKSDKSSSNLLTGDVYDQLLHTISTSPSVPFPLSIFTRKSHIPSLSSLAVTTLATYWEFVEELGNLPTTSLVALGAELSKQRKLTPQAVHLLFPTTSRSSNITDDIFEENCYIHRAIQLSDCSALDEECIFNLFEGCCTHVESLELKNCGHVFTSHLVERLVKSHENSTSPEFLPSIHTLSLTGMYRLQDAYLMKLLTRLPANRLRCLDLSKNSCLSHDGITTLLNCGQFSQLTTLILDSTLSQGDALARIRDIESDEKGDEGDDSIGRGDTIYQENAVTLLCRHHHEAFPILEILSLAGVASLTDGDTTLLLAPSPRKLQRSGSSSDPVYLDIGQRLLSLSLSGCPLLTDRSLANIRLHCRALRSLDLSYLPLLTTPALMGLFLQDKYVPPLEAMTSKEFRSGIENPTALSRSIGPLNRLSLAGLSRSATDDVLMEACVLSSSAGSGLREINVSGCGRIGDKSLACISHHCSHTLERIDLSFIRQITLPVLLHLLGTCFVKGKLTEVTLWGCSQLRRAIVESSANQTTLANGEHADSGNVLEQLSRMKQNSSQQVQDDDSCRGYPTVIGLLDLQ